MIRRRLDKRSRVHFFHSTVPILLGALCMPCPAHDIASYIAVSSSNQQVITLLGDLSSANTSTAALPPAYKKNRGLTRLANSGAARICHELARSESSGETAARRVGQVYSRPSPATLVLHLAGGGRVETTPEHPFYVAGKGFTPAGEVGVGTSIVTRAGPALAVTRVELRQSPAQVYNLLVEDYHTYFVGSAQLWVHNLDCDDLWNRAKQKADAMRSLPASQRPTAAVAMRFPGIEDPLVGVNKSGVPIHESIIDMYNNPNIVPVQSESHLECAEVQVLSDAVRNNLFRCERGALAGGESFAVRVRGPNSVAGKHGCALKACSSCKSVLEYLGITDKAEGLDGFPFESKMPE